MPILLHRKPPKKKKSTHVLCSQLSPILFWTQSDQAFNSTATETAFFSIISPHITFSTSYTWYSLSMSSWNSFIHLLAGVSLSPDFLSTSLAASFHLPFFLNIFWSLSNGKAWVSISDFHSIYTLSLSDLFQTQVFDYHLQSDNS